MSEHNTLKKLIYGGVTFEIPGYQRAYSWEKTQWEQFIDDLQNVQEKYYLGHFLFEDGEDCYQVIDGQQRLTTCMIFFRAVVNCFAARGIVNKEAKLYKNFLYDEIQDKVRLKTVGYDNNYFYNLIINNTLTGTPTTRSQKNIKEALEYFSGTLDQLNSEEILRMAELLSAATVTYYKVADKAMAAQIFAFQNDRGKDLSELEKIKSYLFLQVYLNSSGTKQKDAIEYIDRDFAKIYEGITKIDLHEDSVVNYFWRSVSAKGLYADKTLSEIKGVLAKEADKLEWIKKFTSQLTDAFVFVEHFEQCNDNPYAVRLQQLDNMAWVYPFLFKFNRFGYSLWSPVFNRLLHFLENIIFRAQLRGGRAELTSRINGMLSFQTDTDLDAKISLAVAALKDDNSYWGYWGNGEMCRCLNGYFYGNRVDNYFYWQYELYRNSKNGYGAPSGIKYSDIIRSENIEHIAPRTPSGGNPVLNGYGTYTDTVNSENGIESGQWLNGIGNLMLIAESHNKSIGNCSFADKLASYEKSPLRQQQEIKEFASNNNGMLIWDVEAIKKRQKTMIEAALEIWSLDKI